MKSSDRLAWLKPSVVTLSHTSVNIGGDLHANEASFPEFNPNTGEPDFFYNLFSPSGAF